MFVNIKLNDATDYKRKLSQDLILFTEIKTYKSLKVLHGFLEKNKSKRIGGPYSLNQHNPNFISIYAKLVFVVHTNLSSFRITDNKY